MMVRNISSYIDHVNEYVVHPAKLFAYLAVSIVCPACRLITMPNAIRPVPLDKGRTY